MIGQIVGHVTECWAVIGGAVLTHTGDKGWDMGHLLIITCDQWYNSDFSSLLAGLAYNISIEPVKYPLKYHCVCKICVS